MARRKRESVNITEEVLDEFPDLEDHLREYFRNRVVLSAPVPFLDNSRCWIFTGGTTPQGYGSVRCSLKHHPYLFAGLAHRVHWILDNGDPDGYMLHRCDHPACINPAHLYVGTMEDNLRDASSRRVRAHPLNRSWKLTIYSVRMIRQLHEEGKPVKELAAAFGVSLKTIYSIINYESYRDV